MVSTWQIFCDAGDNFRWEISPADKSSHHHTQHNASPSSSPSLPTFQDVLLQGYSKLIEDCENRNVEAKAPMFRTGSGSSVVVNKSSIAKASSVLGHDFIPNFESGKSCFKGNEFSSPNSMFQTGSGKAVSLSSTGLLRARALLGSDEIDEDCAFQSFEPANKKIRKAHMASHEKRAHSENGERHMVINKLSNKNDTCCSKLPIHMSDSSEIEFADEGIGKLIRPGMTDSTTKPSAIKFHTAGGRFISVSSDALERARNLLGDPDVDSLPNEGDADASLFSIIKHDNADGSFFNKENKLHAFRQPEQNSKIFVSPMKSSSTKSSIESKSETVISGTNLINKFNAEANSCKLNGPGIHYIYSKPSGMPLLDITNTIGIDSITTKGTTTELKRLGRKSSVSPFKMPRSSKFITPLNCNLSSAPNGFYKREPKGPVPRKRVCMRYPFQHSRLYVGEFFKVPPSYPEKLEHLPEEILQLNPQNSEKYTFADGSQSIGVEAFYLMLLHSGASAQHASKKWVANHCKWIVWKLASYERCYSLKVMKKFLTAFNALEELKYRYEREVNHGQRSAIKRILEGDASPSSTLVLCVSEIRTPSSSLVGNNTISTIELTDGWYSIYAQLDLLLSNKLAEGKLFVGQKLRICGACLIGWNGPVSPLEVSSAVCLLLHMNGTYRASWHERLGFCRGACTPLAFRCIRDNGGPVPLTLVGLKRIYPVLYRERLRSGGYVVRSEKMEASFTHQYNQRRSNIIEGIASDFQKGSIDSCMENDYDNEGAKILKMLETAAEPELLMAEMSSEELAKFSKYRIRVEENRQSNLQRSIEKALEDAGLSAREVTPFMRLRVVGLKNKNHCEGEVPREGLITIWNPTEQLKLEFKEGQAYAISGLSPLPSDLSTLYLTARGSTTKWKALSPKEMENYGSFFEPRKAVSLSRLGEVCLSSEFDTAVLVLHVGNQYLFGQQKRQWVFVTDGSLSELETEEPVVSLLAINFCSQSTEDDIISPFNYNLVGSTVGFCNLVKRDRDPVNNMWVADAIENSAYYLNYDHRFCSHLKDAFAAVKKWEQSASLTIEKLREKVMLIIRGPDPRG